ncbi:MAG: polysaccharide deacetylase family protein [Chitinophagaceae bacterium]|nr:polysaccharide deacetylase family protein [Chitinophagaceae bacterium]
MLFYTEKITPRIQYIVRFFLELIFSEPVHFTTDVNAYRNAGGCKLNYSGQPLQSDELWIKPHSLLYETGIRPQDIRCFVYNGQKAFFKTDGHLEFDVFAAAFYLISRYEEYLPHACDDYGRYDYKNSLAYHEQFLQIPLINYWVVFLQSRLKEKFPAASFRSLPFLFIPTYDIDEAWAYQHKSFLRNVGGILRDILYFRWQDVLLRLQVLSGSKTDPYDAYERINEIHRFIHLNPVFFFHVAKKNGRFDKNIRPDTKAMQELIKQHARKFKVGLHPSWQSGDKPSLLAAEKKQLEKIAGCEIRTSRQHYIRFTLPHTYRQLIHAGIQEDYSMGYGSINGFRASVAWPFYWYDLENETATSLQVFPFCFMEATSFFEQNSSPAEALHEMEYYYQQVKKTGGYCIFIWHNTFLGTAPKFKGWYEAYQNFLEKTIQKN